MKKSSTANLFALTSSSHAESARPATLLSVEASENVPLDTDPTSVFWRGAIPVYAEVDAYGSIVLNHRTEIRSRWTKASLYMFFVCPYDELYLRPNPNTVDETNQLWLWDVAELFIGSDFHDIRRYKEFEVSPQGEWIDLDVNLHLPRHEEGWVWNSGFQVSARIDYKASVWYGAMRIPFPAINERPPVVGDLFRVNLFRSQGPPERRRCVAWQAPMSDSFHTPEKFGKLTLVKRN